MNFHLNFNPIKSQHTISHHSEVLFMGSCFSEHIADKLKQLKFSTHSNPFGVIFNPISIINSLERILTKHYFTEKDTFEKNGLWFCFETHTTIFATSQTELLQLLNTIVNDWHKKIVSTNWLVITTGSAYAYTHIDKQKIVANCHKLPQHVFEKKIVSVMDIENGFNILFKKIKTINPNIQIILTVSPVKHLRDGVIENTISKSTLLLATHHIISKNSYCRYFPGYEIVTDDLRDYRFFESDLAHPNKQAIDYVWQKFETTFCNEPTLLLNKKINDINLAFNHKPLQGNTKDYIAFKKTFFEKCTLLKNENPNLDLDLELHYFKENS